jgi:amidase
MADGESDLGSVYWRTDGVGLAKMVRDGDVTPTELLEVAIANIEKLNPALNAVVHRLYDMGRAAAAAAPRDAPFAGVPYLLKEASTQWTGAPLTIASKWMRNVTATRDSEIAKRIKAAGFVIVGKSNAPENGWSISTEPRLYGPTRNPWCADVTPGGSSGGSAAGVAARLVPVAEASDGAGSIRVPASCCGVIGLKPSRGRMTASPNGDSWYGCSYTFCVTRTIRDTAVYLDAVAGMLPGDAYFAPSSTAGWLHASERSPARLRIGFSLAPPDGSSVHPEVRAAVGRTLAALEKLGHDLEEHDLAPTVAEIWPTYTRMTSVLTARSFEALTPLVGAPVTEADVEPVTWSIIQRGRSISGVQHCADIDSVRLMSRAICADLADYDVFVTPTLTQPPRPLGYIDMSESDVDHYNAKWTDAAFMFPFNISGQPAISLPLHWSANGVPIGVQLVARTGDEAVLLGLGGVLEQEMPWRDRAPRLCAGA